MSGNIPWRLAEQHLKQRIEQVRDQLEKAPADHVAQLQGEVRALRTLLNLPHSLAADPARQVEPATSGY